MSHTGTQGGAAGNKAGNVIKDGAKKIHGVGEALRGNINDFVDTATGTKRDNRNEATVIKGVNEIESGHRGMHGTAAQGQSVGSDAGFQGQGVGGQHHGMHGAGAPAPGQYQGADSASARTEQSLGTMGTGTGAHGAGVHGHHQGMHNAGAPAPGQYHGADSAAARTEQSVGTMGTDAGVQQADFGGPANAGAHAGANAAGAQGGGVGQGTAGFGAGPGYPRQ